ncbi:unnamed protein product [Protopolystoma xenopodis]|uniref:Uncharacterized protein n=1 Tax=Protopolystoma xenopodis TaxID=117903 RepID=A0A448WM42_9PLAT|nr:unnamed protein product [Protopolystoma xenopodis]
MSGPVLSLSSHVPKAIRSKMHNSCELSDESIYLGISASLVEEATGLPDHPDSVDNHYKAIPTIFATCPLLHHFSIPTGPLTTDYLDVYLARLHILLPWSTRLICIVRRIKLHCFAPASATSHTIFLIAEAVTHLSFYRSLALSRSLALTLCSFCLSWPLTVGTPLAHVHLLTLY